MAHKFTDSSFSGQPYWVNILWRAFDTGECNKPKGFWEAIHNWQDQSKAVGYCTWSWYLYWSSPLILVVIFGCITPPCFNIPYVYLDDVIIKKIWWVLIAVGRSRPIHGHPRKDSHKSCVRIAEQIGSVSHTSPLRWQGSLSAKVNKNASLGYSHDQG